MLIASDNTINNPKVPTESYEPVFLGVHKKIEVITELRMPGLRLVQLVEGLLSSLFS